MATILELFAGTQSISQVFEKNGWNTFTIENDSYFQDITSWAVDVNTITAKDILERMDESPLVVWASPRHVQPFQLQPFHEIGNKKTGCWCPKVKKQLKR